MITTLPACAQAVAKVRRVRAAQTDSAPSEPVALDLWPCGYRIKCTAPGCRNLARIIVRRVADGGAPDGQSELCNKDARAAIAAAKAKGIAVHDMRKAG